MKWPLETKHKKIRFRRKYEKGERKTEENYIKNGEEALKIHLIGSPPAHRKLIRIRKYLAQ